MLVCREHGFAHVAEGRLLKRGPLRLDVAERHDDEPSPVAVGARDGDFAFARGRVRELRRYFAVAPRFGFKRPLRASGRERQRAVRAEEEALYRERFAFERGRVYDGRRVVERLFDAEPSACQYLVLHRRDFHRPADYPRAQLVRRQLRAYRREQREASRCGGRGHRCAVHVSVGLFFVVGLAFQHGDVFNPHGAALSGVELYREHGVRRVASPRPPAVVLFHFKLFRPLVIWVFDARYIALPRIAVVVVVRAYGRVVYIRAFLARSRAQRNGEALVRHRRGPQINAVAVVILRHLPYGGEVYRRAVQLYREGSRAVRRYLPFEVAVFIR